MNRLVGWVSLTLGLENLLIEFTLKTGLFIIKFS